MDGGAVPVAGFEQAMHELLAGGRERGAGIDGGLIVLHRLLAASGCAHDVREIVVRRRAARIGLQRALQPFDAFPGLVLLEQNDGEICRHPRVARELRRGVTQYEFRIVQTAFPAQSQAAVYQGLG